MSMFTFRTFARLVLACCALLLTVSAAAQDPAEPSAASSTGSIARSVPASRQAENVAIITIDGAIDRWTAVSVRRRLADAEASGADALVVEINSPGGELGSVLEIAGLIKQSTITNTTAWINPEAFSGGAIIAIACSRIVLAPSARFGDALIIQSGPGGVQALPDELRAKLLSPLLADVVDSARRNGYDEYLVQAFVTVGIELWLVRDTQTGATYAVSEAEYSTLFDGEPTRSSPLAPSIGDNTLADREEARAERNEEEAAAEAIKNEEDGEEPVPAAPSEADPAFQPASSAVADLADDVELTLNEPTRRPAFTAADRGRYELVGYVMDGKGPLVVTSDTSQTLGFGGTVIRDDDELQAYFGATNLRRVQMDWAERFARFLTSMPVRGFLIVVLLVSLFLSLTASSPAAGGVSLLCLAALLVPPYVVGMANWWEIAAIVLGIFFIVLEIFVLPGFGVFGVSGLILLFAGLVGTFVRNEPGELFPSSAEAQSDLLYGIVTLLLSTVTSGVGIYYVAKHFGSLPIINRIILKDDPGPDDVDPLLEAAAPVSTLVDVGERGTAATVLRPSGRASFGEGDDERTLDVVAGRGWIEQGTAVTVTAVEGMRVVVEAEDDGLSDDLDANTSDESETA